MVSFGTDLDLVRPRTSLRIFNIDHYSPGAFVRFSMAMMREFVQPIKETLAFGPTLLYGAIHQQLTLW